MARDHPITDETATPHQRLVFEGARTLLGSVPNFIRTVAHSPAAARVPLPFLATAQRMGDETVLSGRLRELAIVRTSILNQCLY